MLINKLIRNQENHIYEIDFNWLEELRIDLLKAMENSKCIHFKVSTTLIERIESISEEMKFNLCMLKKSNCFQ